MSKTNPVDCAVVGCCPICTQGRQLIVRGKLAGELFVYCEECESRWASPADAKNPDKVLLPWTVVPWSSVSVDELCDTEWFSYVINRP
jgi:hypothetical protein